jgi:hypothetical protein
VLTPGTGGALTKSQEDEVNMKKALLLAALAVATLTGTAFAADQYDLKVKAASGKAGEKTVATVSVKPKGAYHVNLEYPHKLVLTAPDGVTVEKAKLVAKDAKISKEAIEFEVAVTPAAKGKKTIEGELKFAVCTDTDCAPQTEKVSIVVDAK